MVTRATRNGRFPGAAWAAVLGWIAVILFLGGDGFSQAQTGSWLAALFPFLTPDQVLVVDGILRKTAHLVEYAVLGVLAYAAFWETLRAGRRTGAMALAVVLVVVVAVVDEGGQLLRANRTGLRQDVLLDGIGGAAGALASRWRRKAAGAPGA